MRYFICFFTGLALFSSQLFADLQVEPIYKNLRGEKRSKVRIVNLNQSDKGAGTLVLLSSSIKTSGTSSLVISDGALINNPTTQRSAASSQIMQQPLVYPNPVTLRSGAELYYYLPKQMDLEVHIYNMLSNLIYKSFFNSGTFGAQQGINVLRLNAASFSFDDLQAGVYIVLFVSAGKVIGKTKFAVLP